MPLNTSKISNYAQHQQDLIRVAEAVQYPGFGFAADIVIEELRKPPPTPDSPGEWTALYFTGFNDGLHAAMSFLRDDFADHLKSVFPKSKMAEKGPEDQAGLDPFIQT